jgi:hypothetical protein
MEGGGEERNGASGASERRKIGMNKNFGKQGKTHARNMPQTKHLPARQRNPRLKGPLITQGTNPIPSSSSNHPSPAGDNPTFHPKSCPSQSRSVHSYYSLSLSSAVTHPVKERQSTRMGCFGTEVQRREVTFVRAARVRACGKDEAVGQWVLHYAWVFAWMDLVIFTGCGGGREREARGKDEEEES